MGLRAVYPLRAVLPLLLAAASVATAEVYLGAGFSTALPASPNPRPYVGIPANTSLVSVKEIKEAQLVCQPIAPVNRVVNCDVHTWDSCGNVYGEDGNQVQWTVSVATAGGVVSRLVSPVLWLRSGVLRFYFTPVVVGTHIVTVTPSAALPTMFTGTSLQSAVTVHDVTARCTTKKVGKMVGQLQDTLWAQAQLTNYQGRVGTIKTNSIPTNVLADRFAVYEYPRDGNLQQDVRRDPLQPFKAPRDIPRLQEDDNNQRLCDMVSRTQ